MSSPSNSSPANPSPANSSLRTSSPLNSFTSSSNRKCPNHSTLGLPPFALGLLFGRSIFVARSLRKAVRRMENRRAYERNRETGCLFASSSLALPPREASKADPFVLSSTRAICGNGSKKKNVACQNIPNLVSLPLWDDTMGNQTPLRGFGDFDLDELDFGGVFVNFAFSSDRFKSF
ncbi:hypothetical protein ZIOFF_005662 [Zingiber officinale]|uniref:Uncharacterized protein n=1 Tax=Zingiber officinale TaxID=94328 RepID=A0A8J5LMR3_ZINOF|nr:hypothetical protein ZIOFF_005662 [Zingiber officinale]